MRIIILGGTQFLGRHLVDMALAHGHDLTLFHRGRTNPDLFGDAVEHIFGDRDGDLDKLSGRTWDACIDTSGYLPRVVHASAERLHGAVAHYTFISTISVYADDVTPHQDESAPLVTLDDESTEEINGDTYGGLKVLCEQVVQTVYPTQALIVRPGLIVGPHDPTDRFSYWPVRIQRGGTVLAPAAPDQPVQVIDARDLAIWILKGVEEQMTGIFNATGLSVPFGHVLEVCQQAANSVAHIEWVDPAFLLDQGVQPWSELPLWLGADGTGIMQTDINRAVEAGLTFRPLVETVADTLGWAATRSPDREWRAGLTPERESALLAAWKEVPMTK